jgi:hypothetical protein
VNQFISIVSAKFGGMDLMKEQGAILSSNSSKKIQISFLNKFYLFPPFVHLTALYICSCRVALRSALKSGNHVIIGEAILKCKEVGLDPDALDLAQNLSRCLNPGR